MAKRYYICPIVGDGMSYETRRRAALVDIIDPATGARAFMPVSIVDSLPIKGVSLTWCLAIADGNHALAVGVKGVTALPDIALDAVLQSDGGLTAAMTAIAVDSASVKTLRDLVTAAGKKQRGDFDMSMLR